MSEPRAFALDSIKRLSKPSSFLEINSQWELSTACEAAKAVLRGKAKQLVAGAGRDPVLTSKSCDGTPMLITKRHQQKLSDGTQVRGHGQAGKEFLVSNQFFRTRDISGKVSTAVTVSEPVALAYSKSPNAIMEASRKDWQSLRFMGHYGPAIEHYCWDRAGLTMLEKLTRQ